MYGRSINRDKSSLAQGYMFGRRRRGLNLWKVGLYALAFAMIGVVMLQFNTIQPQVLALVGVQSTATPNSVTYAMRGQDAYLQGDLDSAINNYTLAAQQNVADVAVGYELVRTLIYRSYGDVRNAADADTALDWATRLVTAVPNSARAQAIYCYALVRKSRTEDGVRACLRALDGDGKLGDAYAYLAIASYDLGRYSTSLEQAERAIRLDPTSIDGNLAYARALTFAGRFEAAQQYFTAAAQINPALEFPYYELASLARRIAITRDDPTRFQLAIAAYNAVLARNPNNVKAYTRLCQAYLEKASRDENDIQNARRFCETATEIDPDYSPGWRTLGEVYHNSRNYESAIDALKTCITIESKFAPELRQRTCWWLRAAGLFVLGKARCDEAIATANDMLSWTQQDDDPQAYREARRVIDKCALAFEEGRYQTPTPVPTPTSPPPPIL